MADENSELIIDEFFTNDTDDTVEDNENTEVNDGTSNISDQIYDNEHDDALDPSARIPDGYSIDESTDAGEAGEAIEQQTQPASLENLPIRYKIENVISLVGLSDYFPETITALRNEGKQPVAVFMDGTSKRVSWDDVFDPSTLARPAIKSEVLELLEATNQHFWNDTNGVHVNNDDKDSWDTEYAKTNHGTLNTPTRVNPWHNILINSFGILLRRGLINHVSVTESAIAFYDGTGNNDQNIIANFGATAAQIGKSSAGHISLTNSGLDVLNGSGVSQAFFGTTARIGAANSNHILLNSQGLKTLDSEGKELPINDIYVKDLAADTAKIHSLTADELSAATAYIATLLTNNVTAQNLTADTAKVHSLTADELSAATAYIATLLTNNVTAQNLTADHADIGTIKADTAKIHSLTADELSAATAYIATLLTNNITAQNLTADHADVGTIKVDTAKIHSLTAEELSAATAYIATLLTNNVTAQNLTADTVKIHSLTAEELSAATAYIASLLANNITAQNLTADHGTITSLDTSYARINLANVDNAWIESGVVRDGAITNAMINSVSANKLTAGTIDASNITVTNLNADNITAGTINGQRIANGSLSLSKLSDAVYTEAEVNAIVEELDNRIDAAIETYTSTAIPTLNNYPASEWDTQNEKTEHIGDVCYVVNAASEADGYCYRFTYNNSTDEFSWQLIKDSDVTAALQRLIDAEGNISGLQTFQTQTSAWITQTNSNLSSTMNRTSSLETRMSDAEGDISNKVNTSTFNELSQTVGENSSSITTLAQTVSTKADSSTVTTLSNTVNSVSQKADTNESSIASLSRTVSDNESDIESKHSLLQQDLNGFKLNVSQSYATKQELSDGIDDANDYTDSEISSAKASIKITTDGISTEVSKKTDKSSIISTINQSAESVTIDAGKVNIAGAALFTSGRLSQTSLDSAYDANGAAASAQSAAISAAATDASTKANTAKSEAISAAAQDASTKANTAESNAKTYAENQASAVNSSLETYKTTTNATLTSLQNQVDGQIEAWYKSVDPTTLNEPASSWNTDALKLRHEGDIYYNVENGHSWRWMRSGTTYSWQQIPDSDAAAALALAQNAQNAANTKRRIFTSTPVVPYDSGDLWVNGSVVKYATLSKSSSESYSESDWVVTATDDTTANSALSIANAAAPKAQAVLEEQYIYITKASGTGSINGTTTWITSTTYEANTWTTKRPQYDPLYPVLFIAKQKKTVSGSITCTTPLIDDTTTVIDGGHITTGTIDANRIAAGSLSIGHILGLQTSLDGKADDSDIPTNVSDLNNDSNYATTTQVNTAKSEAIASASSDATAKANDAAKTATNYITATVNDGIKVHDADNESSYVNITNNAIDIVQSNLSKLKAWTDEYSIANVRIGSSDDVHTLINEQGFSIIDGNDTKSIDISGISKHVITEWNVLIDSVKVVSSENGTLGAAIVYRLINRPMGTSDDQWTQYVNNYVKVFDDVVNVCFARLDGTLLPNSITGYTSSLKNFDSNSAKVEYFINYTIGMNGVVSGETYKVMIGTVATEWTSEPVITLGNPSKSHTVLDYHSMQLFNKEGNTYLHVSDLRDSNGYYLREDTWDGDGSGTYYAFSFEPVDISECIVKIDDVVQADGFEITEYGISFDTAPSANSIIKVIYNTTDEDAIAFTFGSRALSMTSNNPIGPLSVVMGYQNSASGSYSYAEGYQTKASGDYSHAEGYRTKASGYRSHAEGDNTKASGSISHAEGFSTTASGPYSHAEGRDGTASGTCAHIEGSSGNVEYPVMIPSHISEFENVPGAGGYSSHAEGAGTQASGTASHAEGYGTTASGNYSHSSGSYTIASYENQTVIGTLNEPKNAAFIIGNGTYDTTYIDEDGEIQDDVASPYGGFYGTIYRKNIFEIGWNGSIQSTGSIVLKRTDEKNVAPSAAVWTNMTFASNTGQRMAILEVGHETSGILGMNLYIGGTNAEAYSSSNQAGFRIYCPANSASTRTLTFDTANGNFSGPNAIELIPASNNHGHGGYIDFHYNQSTEDYTSRIIEDASGRLTISQGGGSVRKFASGVANGFHVIASNQLNNETVSSQTDGGGIYIDDKNGENQARIFHRHATDGTCWFYFETHRKIGSTDYWNALRCGIDKNGGLVWSVGGAANFRSAISAASTSAASQSAAGLMSAADKKKLDGIATGAQVNPGAASQSAAGLMSAADKKKLDGIATGAQVNPTLAKATSGIITAGSGITISQQQATVYASHVVQVNIHFKPTAAKSGNVTIGTLTATYRPAYQAGAQVAFGAAGSTGWVDTNGNCNVHMGNLTANTEYYFWATFTK